MILLFIFFTLPFGYRLIFVFGFVIIDISCILSTFISDLFYSSRCRFCFCFCFYCCSFCGCCCVVVVVVVVIVIIV